MSNYINMEHQIAPGALGDLKGNIDNILTNYYRGKISKDQMEAQTAALKAGAGAGAGTGPAAGMSKYLPMVAIGGGILLLILLLKKKR
jgi:hypothetical protein